MKTTFLCIGAIWMVNVATCVDCFGAEPIPLPNPTPKVAAPSPQVELFAYIEKKAGVAPAPPVFPNEKLVQWIEGRQRTSTTNEARLLLIGEHLLIAQKLMGNKDIKVRQRGYAIANETANFAAAKLNSDTYLLARIYEALLLPNITLAYVEAWKSPSRQRIIEAASDAFSDAKERGNQIKMLEWLLALGANSSVNHRQVRLDLNTLDWARGTLAVVLSSPREASKVDLERALSLLNAIQSSDMTGFAHIKEHLEKRLGLFKPLASG